MVNDEIFYGIKRALENKETLGSAMESFYNSGYKKEEIEEAARAIQIEQFEQKMNSPLDKKPQQIIKIKDSGKKKFFPFSKEKKPLELKKTIIPSIKTSSFEQKVNTPTQIAPLKLNKVPSAPKIIPLNSEKKTKQKISEYEKPKKEKKPKKDLLIFFLVFILIVLLGVLAAVFLFREDLLAFFEGLI